jgi:predicted Fe-Mo cluster-binding NifX family protein
MDTKHSTVAMVTDDGITISAHFGRALHFEIFTFQDGKVVERNRVSKPGHHTWGEGTHGHGGRDGDGHQGWKHAEMTSPLGGVEVVVARGMGRGAQQHLLAAGIEPILTEVRNIEDAVQRYLAGTLVNDPRRLHTHGSHR